VGVGVGVEVGAGVSVATAATLVGFSAGPQEARGTVLKHSSTPRIDSSLVLTPSSVLPCVGQIISLGIIQVRLAPNTRKIPRTHHCDREIDRLSILSTTYIRGI